MKGDERQEDSGDTMAFECSVFINLYKKTKPNVEGEESISFSDMLLESKNMNRDKTNL